MHTPRAQATPQPRPYWFRADPAFCITGSVFSQPVRKGLLRPDFHFDDCASLDAPQYLPVGSVFVQAMPSLEGDCIYFSELVSYDRERMAYRAALWDEDPYADAYWGDEHGDMGLLS